MTQVTEGGSTTESYSYDAVGNRLSSLTVPTYTYNASNELTSNSNVSYTYDANGNTLTKSDSSGTTQYSFDFENRLTQAVVPGVGTTTFRYDPFGRRIQKAGPLGTINYLYDGDEFRLIEEVDSGGNILARYTQGLMIDEPFAELRSGTTAYYVADGLSSITSLTGASGAVTGSYTYDGFGRLTTSTGSLTNPFQYTARESDPETGLYYYRARYYDPSVGRFLSEDLIGNDEGTDLYSYVSNSAVNLTDPTGMYSLIGFPASKEGQMRDAIQAAINKLRDGCTSCAGPDAPKIINALQTAKFVYKPDLDACGQTINVPVIHHFNHIEISSLAFDFGRCCTLASTVTHEASHLGANTTDKDKQGSAYDIEKRCFNCGTGHPPPKPKRAR